MGKVFFWNAHIPLKCPTKKYTSITSHRCIRISTRVLLFRFPSRVHTRNFHKCNAPFRVSQTHSLLYNFYFSHTLRHCKNLRRYLIYCTTMHSVSFDKHALIMDFPYCPTVFTHLSRTAPRRIINKRKKS